MCLQDGLPWRPKGDIMSDNVMKLPDMQNVRVISQLHPSIMEFADPVPELYQKLDLDQLIQVMTAHIRFQNKMLALEMERLKVQQGALGEIEKLVTGFRR